MCSYKANLSQMKTFEIVSQRNLFKRESERPMTRTSYFSIYYHRKFSEPPANSLVYNERCCAPISFPDWLYLKMLFGTKNKPRHWKNIKMTGRVTGRNGVRHISAAWSPLILRRLIECINFNPKLQLGGRKYYHIIQRPSVFAAPCRYMGDIGDEF